MSLLSRFATRITQAENKRLREETKAQRGKVTQAWVAYANACDQIANWARIVGEKDMEIAALRAERDATDELLAPLLARVAQCQDQLASETAAATAKADGGKW